METRTQNGDGSPGSLRVLRDGGRQRFGETNPREALTQQVQVLSLDQIRIIRSTNEYTEGPTVAPRPVCKPASTSPTPQHKADRGGGLLIEQEPPRVGQRGQGGQHPQHQHGRVSPPAFARSVSSTSAGSRSSAGASVSSASSEHRLLESPPPSSSERVVRAQPERSDAAAEKLKPSAREGEGDGEGARGAHAYRCEACGRCKCAECTCPRALPSCWVCGRRCVCSAQNALDYGSCICCVKGLFYHCSSDDEDVCADEPCSCRQAHCCVRWSAMGVLSLLLPCLLCYLPAKGCLSLAQCCYDRARRPGCRCKHSNVVHCKNTGKLT